MTDLADQVALLAHKELREQLVHKETQVPLAHKDLKD
jgi:hypothetical protein